MSSDEIAIRVQNLSKCYHIYDRPHDRLKQSIVPRLCRLVGKEPKNYFREFGALKDVSFEVKKGETVGIIGRNGSGKSTLLQLICGTLNPTSGSIQTHGRIAALLELGSGFNPEFTGRENVYMNAAVLGLSKEETDARFDEIVSFADIGDFIEQPVKTYSSGMMVRLAFAVIAHVNADILVVDEALAVGDTFFTQKCMRFLRQFQQRGTVLFVSHDIAAIVNLCGKALWLDHGIGRMFGPPKEVCETYFASQYENKQQIDEMVTTLTISKAAEWGSRRGMRLEFPNHSNLRHGIEVFRFADSGRSFGNGGAEITDARFLDGELRELSWINGGEAVCMLIEAIAIKQIRSVIVGFNLKDRLGQILFGLDTYPIYRSNPVSAEPGEKVSGVFEFCMPILPPGKYLVDVAIADGSREDYVYLEWLHDVILLESHSSQVFAGLVGIPFRSIRLQKTRPNPDDGGVCRTKLEGIRRDDNK